MTPNDRALLIAIGRAVRRLLHDFDARFALDLDEALGAVEAEHSVTRAICGRLLGSENQFICTLPPEHEPPCGVRSRT